MGFREPRLIHPRAIALSRYRRWECIDENERHDGQLFTQEDECLGPEIKDLSRIPGIARDYAGIFAGFYCGSGFNQCNIFDIEGGVPVYLVNYVFDRVYTTPGLASCSLRAKVYTTLLVHRAA